MLAFVFALVFVVVLVLVLVLLVLLLNPCYILYYFVVITVTLCFAHLLLKVHGLLCGPGLCGEARGSRVGRAAGLRAVCLPYEGRIRGVEVS